MNATHRAPEAAPRRWSLARWAAAGLFFAAAEAGPLMGWTRWPGAAPATPTPVHRVWWLAGQDAPAMANLLAGDPVVFARPDSRGFSGQAERALPRPTYGLAETPSTPSWLALSASMSLGPVPPGAPPRAAWPGGGEVAVDEPPPLLNSRSWVEHVSGLSGRSWKTPDPPAALMTDEVLRATVVDVAVNAAGDALWGQLVSSCGWAEGDAIALRLAGNSWFEPAATPARGFEPERPVGIERLSFHWRSEAPLR